MEENLSYEEKELIGILEFLIFKLRKKKCSHEEIESWSSVAKERLTTNTTIKDAADFFDQSESNVRNIMCRRVIPKEHKPKRVVLFSFNYLLKVIPKSWLHKRYKDTASPTLFNR